MGAGSRQPRAATNVILLLLLAASGCTGQQPQLKQKQAPATTSLAQQTSADQANSQAGGQAGATTVQIKGRRLMAAGDSINQNPQPDYPSSLLTIQIALVSVKGALGFARPTWQPPAAATASSHAPAISHPALLPQPAGGARPSFACPVAATAATKTTSQRSTRLNVIKPTSPLVSPRSLSLGQLGQQQPQVELSALEGATMHLNLGLLGSELHAKSTKLTPTRLKLHWTRNGQSINGARFGPLRLINRQDQSGGAAAARSQVTLSDQFAVAESASQQPLLSTSQTAQSASLPAHSLTSLANSQADPYLLDPYLDERLAASRGASQSSSASVDDFLADGRNIDWPRFERYLRSRLGLNWTNDEPDTTIDGSCSLSEQLSVVQVSMADVTLEDAGLYEASICLIASSKQADESDSSEDTTQCQVATNFLLKPVEDLPQLELRASHSGVLNSGDRLSIKCEASGYTLPQITWYLDGWRLSEHSFSSSKLLETSTYSSLGDVSTDDIDEQELEQSDPLTGPGWQASRLLRIGDYVSQVDQHVHSFVNSSHLEVNDGGSYKCVANNGRHQVEREIRVDVRGPPTVARRLLNRNVLAGSNQVHIQCPYSGYPVAAIEWYFRRASSQQQQRGRARSKRRPDSDREPDPERDEWLSQAGSITAAPDEELPPELPTDYRALDGAFRLPLDGSLGNGEDVLAEESDYSDLDINFGSLDENQQEARLAKRDAAMVGGADEESSWIKLPQGRHHQVHLNGTLILQSVQRSDQGYYKCRVLAPSMGAQQLTGSSNQLYLTVLVAPVISPFGSTESLREGMRNFLTCSVIEGDSPIRLSWLKDGRPIEAHIAEMEADSVETALQARIRVETSNEYTSTLYFSRVEYKDNGNYTCTAANKAASVNYTAKMLVNVPPKWTKVPKDVECVAGQSIVIDCLAQAHPNPRIWWEVGLPSAAGSVDLSAPTNRQLTQAAKEGQPLASATSGQLSANSLQYNHHHHHHHQPQQQQSAPIHYRTIISNSRIHILENASLVIREVARTDQGYYLCQAANNFGSLSALIHLKVNVAASFANKFQTRYVRLLDHLELDCDPVGQSPIELVWLKRPLTLYGSNQSGSGAPLARQASLQADSQTRRLYASQIRTDLSSTPSTVSSVEQQHPHFSIDDSITFQTHTYRRSTSDDVKAELVRLSIDQVRRQHSAEYVCKATNQYGTDEKVIKLLVQEPPEPVQEINVIQVESRSATLSWFAPFNGNSPITSYLVEWIQIEQPTMSREPSIVAPIKAAKWAQMTVQQASASIGPLQPMTNYEVRVRAQNQFGMSPLMHATSSSGFVLVSTLEEPPSSPPSDIRALAVSSSCIQLSWAPPRSTMNGADPFGSSRFSVKGYYLGYRPSSSNDSYIFKTVSLAGNMQEEINSKPSGGHLLASTESYHKHNRSSFDQEGNLTAVQTAEKSRLKVLIEDLRRSTKYTIIVQAFNSAGPGPQSDPIEAKTLLDDPPPAPQVRFGLITYTSIELQWSFLVQSALDSHSKLLVIDQQVPMPAIDGYLLYYRRTSSISGETTESSWLEKRLNSETHTLLPSSPSGSSIHKVPEYSLVERHSVISSDSSSSMAQNNPFNQALQPNTSLAHRSFRFILDQLSCGSPYQLYLVAYNSIGTGQPSQIMRTKTRGSTPSAPRKDDYIVQINSTMIQLNFDAWQDGGCSIINYEVKYKQVMSASLDVITSEPILTEPVQKYTGVSVNNLEEQLKWILVSSNISPEQQNLDIRDLKPETWYTLSTKAESAAGKTEAQYTFITLDRFGQVSLRALESTPSNLPSFFRSSSGSVVIRSLLANFTSASGHISPLIVGSCLCLMVLIVCSIFILRRNQANSAHIHGVHSNRRDNFGSEASKSDIENMSSFDSQGHYGISHYQQPDHLHMQLAQSGSTMRKQGNLSTSPHSIQHEHCSANGSSPCKTTTTVVTNSTSSNESNLRSESQDRVVLPIGYQNLADDQVDSRFTLQESSCQVANDYCLSPRALLCESSPSTKFAPLSRDNDWNGPVSRFRTLPHPGNMNRPVSTFLSSNQPARIICHQQQESNRHDCNSNMDQQQQLYSKFKLMCTSNSHYNLFRDGQLDLNVQVPKLQQAQDIVDRNLQINLTTLVNQQKLLNQVYSDDREQQSMKSRAIEFINGDQQTIDNLLNQSTGVSQPNQDCQRQIFDTREDLPRLNFSCNQTNYLEQQHTSEPISYSGFSGPINSHVNGSTTTYTINSSSQQSNSSAFQIGDNAEDQQLIDIANGNQNIANNQAQCPTNVKLNSKSFHGGGGCPVGHLTSATQATQTNLPPSQGQPTNEQSDYALPFPPKWV